MMTTFPPNTTDISPEEQRHQRYLELIDQLLQCPNGQEPDVLDRSLDLIDADFINVVMQTATYFAHQNNEESAKFLIFIARELSHQLGLYPEVQQEPLT